MRKSGAVGKVVAIESVEQTAAEVVDAAAVASKRPMDRVIW